MLFLYLVRRYVMLRDASDMCLMKEEGVLPHLGGVTLP